MLELRGEPTIAKSSACAPPLADACGGRRLASLEGVVRHEILPRLLQVHARAAPAPPLEVFARALIDADDGAAPSALARLSAARGGDVRLMHEILAPAARLFGEWWEQDTCDFLDVSHAVARLQVLLAGLAASERDDARAPTMLLLTPPRETHVFGAQMAAELLRRDGWRVRRADADLSALKEQAFDAVGVSCGCERGAKQLAQFIADIRKITRRRPRPILLGGALFEGRPARAENLGVDFVACDLNSTRRISRALLQPRSV